MAIKILVEPAIEPVILAEAKAWLRLDHAEEDDLISALIRTARIRCEQITGRAMITQSVQQTSSRDQRTGIIDLALGPVQSVQLVAKVSQDGIETIVDPLDYVADLDNRRLLVGVFGSIDNFRLEYTAGYGDLAAKVPAPLKTAILLQVAWLFEHRDEAGSTMPYAAQALLANYRWVRL